MSKLKVLWWCSWVIELLAMFCALVAVFVGNLQLVLAFIAVNAISFVAGRISAHVLERHGQTP